MFVALYLPGQTAALKNDMSIIANFFPNSEAVIGCDLNVKHLSRGNSTVNGNGTHLFDWISNNVRFSIKGTLKPTSIAEKSETFLDFFITTAFVDIVFRGNYNNCLKTYSYESDHAPVEVILNSGSVERRPNLECFNYATMDVDSFHNSLEELLLSFLLPIDHNVSIHQIIQELIKISEDEYWTDVFKNIGMDNKTYKKIKALARISRRPEIDSFNIEDGSEIRQNS